MNYRPDENDWMGYLYGELDPETEKKMAELLRQDPEARETLAQMQRLRSALQLHTDKEVITPVFVPQSPAREVKFPYWRTLAGIAAAVLLIMVAARFLELRLSFSENEMTISFGEVPAAPVTAPPAEPGITAKQISDLINESLKQNNENLNQQLLATRIALQKELKSGMEKESERIDQLVAGSSKVNEAEIRQFVSTLQTENLRMVKDYMKMSAKEQNAYMEGLLVDFSKYMQEQRKTDLKMLETRLTSVERNTNEIQEETGKLLATFLTGKRTEKEVNY